MTNIRYLRTRQGLGVIADVSDCVGNDSCVMLKSPLSISVKTGATETETYLLLIPWIPIILSDETEVMIQKSEIIFSIRVKQALEDYYENHANKLYADKETLDKLKSLDSVAYTGGAANSDTMLDDFLNSFNLSLDNKKPNN